MDSTSNKNFRAVKQNFLTVAERLDIITERLTRMENTLAILQAEINNTKQLAKFVGNVGPTVKQ